MPLQGDPYAIAKALLAGSEVWRDNRKAERAISTAFRAKLSHPGSGRAYSTRFWTDNKGRLRKGGQRALHTASAPGQPPARDTGHLLNSMDINGEAMMGGAQITVTCDAFYGGYLEYGTSKMAARPFFRPVMAEQVPRLSSIWASGIEGRERGAARRAGGTG